MSRLHSYQWTIPEGRMRRQVNPQCVFEILLSALPRPALQAVVIVYGSISYKARLDTYQ